jgi:hypothetical protein
VEKISTNKAFKKALSSLSLAKQRQVGARFIANVLDLTEGNCTKHAQMVAENSNITAEELENAYHAVRSVYVATNPRSGFTELDYGKQAAHFVAEACMVCLAPTHGEYRTLHLAEKVAGYCHMARICSSIQHEDEYPRFSDAEKALKKEMEEEFQILNEFLENN